MLKNFNPDDQDMDGTTRKPLHLLVTKDTEHLSEVEKKIERENHRKVVAATTAV